jgi:cytochrome c oxidase subunit II
MQAQGFNQIEVFLMKPRFLNAVVILFCLVIATTVSSYGQEAARVIEIHAKRFSFIPAEITIRKGETVKLVLTSDDVTHSLVIPDLHVNAKITKGKSTELTITPNTTWDIHGRCGHFCGSGHGTMTFTVHVTED